MGLTVPLRTRNWVHHHLRKQSLVKHNRVRLISQWVPPWDWSLSGFRSHHVYWSWSKYSPFPSLHNHHINNLTITITNTDKPVTMTQHFINWICCIKVSLFFSKSPFMIFISLIKHLFFFNISSFISTFELRCCILYHRLLTRAPKLVPFLKSIRVGAKKIKLVPTHLLAKFSSFNVKE